MKTLLEKLLDHWVYKEKSQTLPTGSEGTRHSFVRSWSWNILRQSGILMSKPDLSYREGKEKSRRLELLLQQRNFRTVNFNLI